MDSKIINISLPSELVERIDKQAKLEFSTRSAYIKHAVITRLKNDNALEKEIPIEDAETLLKRARQGKLKRAMEQFSLKELDFEN